MPAQLIKMLDFLKLAFTQRATLLPALMVLVGFVLHIRGIALSDAEKAAIQHQIASLFDAVGIISGMLVGLHAQNASNVTTNTSVIQYNAKVLDDNTPKEVKVATVACVDNTPTPVIRPAVTGDTPTVIPVTGGFTSDKISVFQTDPKPVSKSLY